MPKPIQFLFEEDRLVFQMEKVDRSKLYGFKEILVTDENESLCELATLAVDGKTLVGKGGTGIGQLTADGKWTNKNELKPVNLEGQTLKPVPSSFSAPIELNSKTDADDYLNHNIRLVYRLSVDKESASEESIFQQLKNGVIYKFPYSFRGGLEADVGFLLVNDSNEIFMLVGESTAVAFVGLQQSAQITSSDSDEEELLDFGMM